MIRALRLTILLAGFLVLLTSCGKKQQTTVDVGLLATDAHVSIAHHSIVVPLVAFNDHAHRNPSFSLGRKDDSDRARDELNQFLRDTADPKNPLVLDSLSVVVQTYGWNDSDMSQRGVCPLLTRDWARSVCDDPWSAVLQALPANRFRLVNLSRLHVADPGGPIRCSNDEKPNPVLNLRPGDAVMICSAEVFGGRDDQYHHAVMRIDGDLGASWMVWRNGKAGETAEAMTEREGKAIAAFVRYALGKQEDFPKLHAAMCRLRRPGSPDGPQGADCERVSLSSLGRN